MDIAMSSDSLVLGALVMELRADLIALPGRHDRYRGRRI